MDEEEKEVDSEYGTPVKENHTFSVEIERLELQNSEYREKLLRTIRERDLNEELLKNVQGQHKKELDSQAKRIKELETQLKTSIDKSLAQEAHFNVTSREMSQKLNVALQNATKKAEQADKEKNEAVVKYAMREAEMMKLRAEIEKKGEDLKAVKAELETTRAAHSQEQLEQIQKTLNGVNVELETVKHEKFEFEHRMKIAEKRVETLTSSLSESKQQCDVLRKQLIQSKDEKAQKQLSNNSELEKRLKESESDMERLKVSQLEMATKFEESSRENTDLLAKIDILTDQLTLEEDRRKLCEEQVERLKNVENFVQSSSSRIEESQKEKQDAEEEAIECREHAERMLRLNQELTQRNMDLTLSLKTSEVHNELLNRKIEQLTGKCDSLEEKCRELENSPIVETSRVPDIVQPDVSEDTSDYILKLQESTDSIFTLQTQLQEEKNNFAAYKKKSSANLKELRAELSKKQNSSSGQNSEVLNVSSGPSQSSRSRASSITSIDRVTSTSQDDAQNENPTPNINMQQVMIDKIVILQRKLARRTEKCEFLEEHVRQCLEELQKKTKIIQHFALREEASLLMPIENSIEKVPIVRKGAAYALMGAMFTGGSEKRQSQVLSELNSRLQAVLEDVIQKNIAMRTSVDSLTSENTRLSRENRLLSLSN